MTFMRAPNCATGPLWRETETSILQGRGPRLKARTHLTYRTPRTPETPRTCFEPVPVLCAHFSLEAVMRVARCAVTFTFLLGVLTPAIPVHAQQQDNPAPTPSGRPTVAVLDFDFAAAQEHGAYNQRSRGKP